MTVLLGGSVASAPFPYRTQVSKPNQEHKKRCMLGLLADAVQRYSAELAQLLGDRTLRLIVETEDFAVVFRGQHWKLPAFAMCTGRG